MRPIDADVVIKHIEEYWEMVKLGKPSRGMTAVIQNIKTIINSLPTIDAEPHWIPCSERLPDDNATVLITHRGGVSFGWYNGRYWERGANTKHRPLQTVTAWMPLPEPYEVKE